MINFPRTMVWPSPPSNFPAGKGSMPYSQTLFGNKQEREKQQLEALQRSARDIIKKIEALEADLISTWELIEKKKGERKKAQGEYDRLTREMKNLKDRKDSLDSKSSQFKELDKTFNQKLRERGLVEARIKMLTGVITTLERDATRIGKQIEGSENDKKLADKVLRAPTLAFAHASYRNISGRFLK